VQETFVPLGQKPTIGIHALLSTRDHNNTTSGIFKTIVHALLFHPQTGGFYFPMLVLKMLVLGLLSAMNVKRVLKQYAPEDCGGRSCLRSVGCANKYSHLLLHRKSRGIGTTADVPTERSREPNNGKEQRTLDVKLKVSDA
jgi:hypothetical protein